MKKLITLIIVYWIALGAVYAQRPLSPADIGKTISYFSLEEKGGKGLDVLNQAFQESDFIVYGELHNSQQNALIFDYIVQQAAGLGFDKLALEIGPVSAKTLSGFRNSSFEELRAGISRLYQRYVDTGTGYPIPFFKGEEDLNFLHSALESDYELWGLDQEFLNSFDMLFDKMIEAQKKKKLKANAIEAKTAWTNNRKVCSLLEDPTILGFFNSLKSKNEAQAIAQAALASAKIYCLNGQRKYKENNLARIDYMRQNLLNHLEASRNETGEMPKVLFKYGSQHTTRIQSFLGYQDLGFVVDSLAYANNKKSIHITLFRRYWNGKDTINEPEMATAQPILMAAKRDQWTLIDLRPLRKAIEAGDITADEIQKGFIFNQDIVLICPEDVWVKNHYAGG